MLFSTVAIRNIFVNIMIFFGSCIKAVKFRQNPLPNRNSQLLRKLLALGVPFFGHEKQSRPPAFFRPQLTGVTLFFGIVGRYAISALIFHNQNPPVFEKGDKIGVETVV